MKKAIGILVALLSAAVAVVLMILPTYTTAFGAQGGGRGFETPIDGSTPFCLSISTLFQSSR